MSNSSSEPVRIDRRPPVWVVTIDRPHRRNAVDPATAAELTAAFSAFDDDTDAAVAVLTGAAGVFSAGFDLISLGTGEPRPTTLAGHGPMGPTRMRLGKPVIAAVEGHAVAGGFELALWCDLRVAGRSAVFGIYNRRWGIPLVDLGTVRLPRLVGHSHAMDLILTGRGVSGEEALRMGLANRLVDDGAALEAAIELAQQLAHFPQPGLRNDRLSAIEQWGLSEQAAGDHELARGLRTIADDNIVARAATFARGAGRHGGPVEE